MSTGIPKSLREALSRQAVRGPHPAADQLTAYAERSLSEKEESAVIGHLATCAECREVVFLAHSAYEAPQKPVIVYERRSMWRWAMPATALLAFAIGFVVLLRNENPKVPQSAQVTKQAQQVQPANEQATDKIEKAAPPSAATTAPTASAAKATTSVPARSGTKAKAEEKRALASTTALPVVTPRAENSPRNLAMAAPMTPIVAQPGAGSSVAGKILNRAAMAPPAAPPLSMASGQMADADQNTNALSVQSLQLGGPSPRQNQATKGVAASTTPADVVSTEMTAAAVPAPPTLRRRDETKLPEERRAEGQFQAFATNSIELDAAPQKQQRNAFSRMALTVWRISSDGHLERMMQNQWHRALGSVQKSFRTVAYLGTHVWAGGSGPELYHSADGGDSWNTLKVKTEDTELRGAMQSIKATDEKHVAIIADDGSVWVTNDGGTTWTKQ